MMKYYNGFSKIVNPETGGEKEIICKSRIADPLHIFIGGTLIILGICNLMTSSYKMGADAFEDAEYKTLKGLKLLK